MSGEENEYQKFVMRYSKSSEADESRGPASLITNTEWPIANVNKIRDKGLEEMKALLAGDIEIRRGY